MRRDQLYLVGVLALAAWMLMTYFLFVHRPETAKAMSSVAFEGRLAKLSASIDYFGQRLDRQLKDNQELLREVRDDVIELASESKKKARGQIEAKKAALNGLEKAASSSSPEVKELVIPVLMFACNRPTVRKAIDPLLEYRGEDPERIRKFPIIVSQDCAHAETANVISSYGDKVVFLRHPDQSEPEVPKAERKFRGYFKIARHYGWALNQTFVHEFQHEQVIIVEDDLEVAPDFFEYFEATLPILRRDPSLWCVSAWNDNGKKGLIDESRPDLLHRTDFFGGLGWMITRDLWVNELMRKWPRSYWDDWMRQPVQRKSRACIRPEISRTKTFGKIGVSNGLFYEKHLKYIQLNAQFYPFTQHNLDYLTRDAYDARMAKELAELGAPVSARALPSLAAQAQPPKAVKVIYRTKADFKAAVKVLGIMDDSKSGVPRMAYKGVVPTMYKGIRVYLSPGLNWKGYPNS